MVETTITMMMLRSQPGEYAHRASKHGETFIVTSQSRPVFKIVPIENNALQDNSEKQNLPLSVEEWVKERHQNCLRIMEGKTSAEDRALWKEDATYFELILERIAHAH